MTKKTDPTYKKLPTPVEITLQKWDDDVIPLVSIGCKAYNHEAFIEDAIKGFLMQKTTFPVEIVIWEDCSTDKTAEIVKHYEEKYPQLFKCTYQIVNQNGRYDEHFVKHKPRRGKYIALCEGDDYWTDPLKLQKQVDFLKENEEYVFVSGNAVFHKSNQKHRTNVKTELSINDFISGNMLGHNTASLMYRSELIDAKYHELRNYKWPFGDLFLYFWLLNFGKAYVFEDVFSYYRIHKNGVWSSLSKLTSIQKMILFYSLAHKFDLNKDYNRAMFEKSISVLTARLMSKPQKKNIFKTIKNKIKQKL